MINIAICDDSKKDRETLNVLLLKALDKLNLELSLSVYSSGVELCKSDKKHDIIFLDIVMDKLDGIETLKKLADKDAIVIFMSSTTDRIRELFDLNVIAFLDKPIMDIQFEDAISKAIKIIKASEEGVFSYSKNGLINIVKLADIICIESEKHYLNIFTQKNVISFKGIIRDVWAELSNKAIFCMPNRSYIVNMKYITVSSKTMIHIEEIDKDISIGRTNKDDTMQRLMTYIKLRGNEF